MRTGALTALVIFFLLSAGGCFSRESIPNQRALDPTTGYIDALEHSTRQTEHFESLDVHVHVFATQLNTAFQKAYRQEYRDVYGVYPEGGRELDSEKMRFVLAIAANNNDLTSLGAFSSLWMVAYTGGVTQPVAPVAIEAYDRDALFLRYFFPYWNPWRQVYRFEFPVPATATSGSLVLQGPVGNIRLDW